MTKPMTDEELQVLGDKIDPNLSEILLGIDKAVKLVESDGTSYRHMPDYFIARGRLVDYIKSYAKDYAEMVVGANEAVGLPTTQAQEQRNYDKKVRNRLRAEQRERMQ